MESVVACVAVLSLGLGVVGDVSSDPDDPDPVFAFADRQIQESSGLVARDGLFVTVNDSGDSPRIFTIDPSTGATVGTTTWPGEVIDVEGLAPAPDGEVWVGDIGDNLTNRSTIQVRRVPSGRGDQTVTPPTYDLDYPDGPHDAETLLAHPVTGRVYVISKDIVGGRVYQAPETLDAEGPNRMDGLVGDVLPIATDGAFFPDGKHLLVRTYAKAEIYTFPDLEEVAEVDLPFQQQGEGVAIDESGRIYLSSEGDRAEVLEVTLSKKLQKSVLGVTPEKSTPAPTPEPDKPLWPYLFMGGMGAVVLLGLIRMLRGGSED